VDLTLILNQALAVGIALVVGYLLKNKTSLNNQAIPIVNFLLQFFGRLALEIKPAEAGIFSVIGAAAYSVLFESAATTVLASGMQSSAKATGRTFLSVLKFILAQRAAAAAQKIADKTPPPPLPPM